MRIPKQPPPEAPEFLTVEDIEDKIGMADWSANSLVDAVRLARIAVSRCAHPQRKRPKTVPRRKRERALGRLLALDDDALIVLLVLWERLKRGGADAKPIFALGADDEAWGREVEFLTSRIAEIKLDRTNAEPSPTGGTCPGPATTGKPDTSPRLIRMVKDDLQSALPGLLLHGHGGTPPEEWPFALRRVVDLIKDDPHVADSMKRSRRKLVAVWAEKLNPRLPKWQSICSMITRANTR